MDPDLALRRSENEARERKEEKNGHPKIARCATLMATHLTTAPTALTATQHAAHAPFQAVVVQRAQRAHQRASSAHPLLRVCLFCRWTYLSASSPLHAEAFLLDQCGWNLFVKAERNSPVMWEQGGENPISPCCKSYCSQFQPPFPTLQARCWTVGLI